MNIKNVTEDGATRHSLIFAYWYFLVFSLNMDYTCKKGNVYKAKKKAS